MQTVTFGYNKFQIYSRTISIIPGAAILTSAVFILDRFNEWLVFIPIAVVLFCIARVFVLNFTLPMLKKDPALIMDNEKLISLVQDETIYWKDVVKFSKHGGLYHGYFLFEMADGEFIRIGTRWVEEDTDTIYNYIQSFMAHFPSIKLT